jgi:hypothetical protein
VYKVVFTYRFYGLKGINIYKYVKNNRNNPT